MSIGLFLPAKKPVIRSRHLILITFFIAIKTYSMVPTLLYLLIKKLRKYDWSKFRTSNVFFLVPKYKNPMTFTLLVLLLLISLALGAQKQLRHYKIMRKGNEIGWMSVEKQTDSNATTFTMGTEV